MINIIFGQTIRKVEYRWANHRCMLKNERHCNPYLQNAWDKYGEQNFTFGILASEITTIEKLNEAEKF